MKKFLIKPALLSAFLCLATHIEAQVIAALHHNGQTTMYYNQNGLVDSYNASVTGDTIYLSGGHFNPVTINKKISVFGAGVYADSSAATGVTYIDGNINLQGQSDQTRLEGLQINGHVFFQTDSSINQVIISRCYITGRIEASGSRNTPSQYVTIKENIIGNYITLSNGLQWDISNNFIHSEVDYAYNCSIRNNVFFSAAGYGWPYYIDYNIYDCDNSLIENNVFLRNASYFFYCDNSLARNNIFVQSPSFVAGSGTLNSNYVNITASSIFIQQTSASFNFSDNYHLQNPATYLGSDGTQAGVYGGAYPYKPSAVPVNPHIRSVVVPQTTDVNGNLNINIQAGAQQQ